MDLGATLDLGFDGKDSVQEFQTLLHADEAKPSARLGCLDVKAHARIDNREMKLLRCPPQSNFDQPFSTVLCRVIQSLLQDPEKAKRNLRGQGTWQIMCFEIIFHFLFLG